AMALLFVQTLPIDIPFSKYFAPDVLFGISLAWVLRRPDAMTPLLIALVLLAADLILHRPPGLWAAIVVSACVFLTMRAAGLKETLFSVEWGLVAAIIFGCFAIYQFLLIVTFSQAQPLGLTVLQAVTTVLVYPILTWGSRQLFGIARLSNKDARSGKGAL
ncbi:MAG: rod shape-determining protein MreD, partial [Pseudomonadota bacterium]